MPRCIAPVMDYQETSREKLQHRSTVAGCCCHQYFVPTGNPGRDLIETDQQLALFELRLAGVVQAYDVRKVMACSFGKTREYESDRPAKLGPAAEDPEKRIVPLRN